MTTLSHSHRDWEFAATNTHLYSGAKLRVVSPHEAAAIPQGGDSVRIGFADLGFVLGHVTASLDKSFEVAMRSHSTARGARISPRKWQIELDPSKPLSFRVRSRIGR